MVPLSPLRLPVLAMQPTSKPQIRNKKDDIIAVMQRYDKLADGIITEIEGAITISLTSFQ